MPPSTLSPGQIDQLVELRGERGWSHARIAAKLGCSQGAVVYQCLRLGIEHPDAAQRYRPQRGPMTWQRRSGEVRRFTPEEDARLLALEAQGMSYKDIARTVSRAYSSVRLRLMWLARLDSLRETGEDRHA